MSKLQAEIRKVRAFESLEQEAVLNVMRTHSLFEAESERFFRRWGLSGATYNVLRILRGAAMQGLDGRPCHEIGEHMVSMVPDVTRLVDRLEKTGLVERTRCGKDRRVVYVRLTAPGSELLGKIDAPLMEFHKKQLGHMSRENLTRMNELLVEARTKPAS